MKKRLDKHNAMRHITDITQCVISVSKINPNILRRIYHDKHC